MALPAFDLTDPDTFTPFFPHALFKRLRAEAPVYWHEKGPARGGAGFFVLSRYDDIFEVSRNPGVFSSVPGITIIEQGPQDFEAGQSSMLQMDPPQHVRYRKLVSPGFTPRRIGALEPVIRLLVDEVLDAAAAKNRVDFVTEIAAELPLRTIARFLGVPEDERHILFSASNRLIGFEDSEYGTTAEDGRAGAIELAMLAHRLAEARKLQPADDIVTILQTSEVDGARLSDLDFIAFFVLLTVAGNETTRNQTSHTLRLLLEHPDQMARVQADPSLLPSAIEEALRYNPAVMYFRRTATCDTEIRGVKIPKGSKVVLYYPSANRDEAVFPDPDRFDVGRTPNEHLAFGTGEHFCLGASLARLQLRSMIGGVLQRFPRLRLDGPISHLRSHFINGIKHMNVLLEPDDR